MNRSYFLAAPLLVALCALPASARDQQAEHNSVQHVRDAGHDHDRARQQHWREEREQRLRHAREERERRLRHEREERWRREHRTSSHDPFRHGDHDRRAGWEHGKKKGWHGADVAPGQAKKTAYEKHHGR
jgi:hypothetical protein